MALLLPLLVAVLAVTGYAVRAETAWSTPDRPSLGTLAGLVRSPLGPAVAQRIDSPRHDVDGIARGDGASPVVPAAMTVPPEIRLVGRAYRFRVAFGPPWRTAIAPGRAPPDAAPAA